MNLKNTLAFLSLSLVLLGGCESASDISSDLGTSSKSGRPSSVQVRSRAVESPSDFLGQPTQPRVVEDFAKTIPSNDWWTSLIWPFYPANNFGENLYAHPLILKALPDGLALGHPDEATITPDDVNYTFHFQEDLRIGVEGVQANQILVEDYTDWTVTPRWEAGPTWMNATIGHGLLFSYIRTNGTQARIRFPQNPVVFSQEPGALGVTINGRDYGLFAPRGENWSMQGNQAAASLGERGYFSVALLPQGDSATLRRFQESAFSFVTDTQVSWKLEDGQVTATYQVSTEALEGQKTPPPLALYRHQAERTEAPLESWSFQTPRGIMTGLFADSFSTRVPFTGVLPHFPLANGLDRSLLNSFLDEVASEGPLLDKDTYFGGKDLGKLAALIPIAEQLGREDLKDLWLNQIQGRLDDYFDGRVPYRFVYNDIWDTLLADPVAFESDRYLNDHHFHYGYLVMGSAILARYRPHWASVNRASVDEMILDVANPERQSDRYPFLRNFDPYAGHSWASGAQNFAGGNNQESSSESIYFSSALILWGQETGQARWVDLGAYLYSTEVEAVWEYWFDKDEVVFPHGFQHPALGILWGGGGAYATWWTDNPEEIHGINFLPIHGGSLYLGHYPEALRRNLDHLIAQAGQLLEWRDIIWSAQAFLNPEQTLADFLTQRPQPEGGESRAHTYHWLGALAEFGNPRTDITADTASFAVLEKDGRLSYLAYNPTTSILDVTFSSGFTLSVPGKSVALSSGADVPVEPDPPNDTVDPDPPETVGRLITELPTDFNLASAESGQWVATPHNSEVIRLENIVADFTGGGLKFTFPVDAGRGVGAAVQVEFRLDFDGDGQVDRREVYHYFPTNDVPGPEDYKHTRGLLSEVGAYADFHGGTVEIEFWSPIGGSATQVLSQGSEMTWPYLASSTEPPDPDPDPDPVPAPLPTQGATRFRLGSEGLAQQGIQHTLPAGDGLNHDGSPFRSRRWTVGGLWGSCEESLVEFRLPVDSGRGIANAVQARLLYDFDGDGEIDRTTTFGYFPTNDVVGFEDYRSTSSSKRSAGAAWGSFQGGRVTLEVWSALGTVPATVSADSALELPLD
jgi:endoglucanase Acf2